MKFWGKSKVCFRKRKMLGLVEEPKGSVAASEGISGGKE